MTPASWAVVQALALEGLMLRLTVAVLIAVQTVLPSLAQSMEDRKVAQSGSAKEEKSPAPTRELPSKEAASIVSVPGTVAAIDKDKGTVTLKGPRRSITLEVRDKAKLDVIKVGDPVIARYVEALAIEVKKPGTTTPGTTVQESRVSSNPGETPAGAVGREVSVTATVTAIDKKGQTVTIKGPEGNSETIKAVDPKNLDAVKVGDMVEIRYFQALAVSLDKSAGK